MTFLQLQTLTGQWLDDTAFGYFTLATVKTWLNNSQRELQKLLLNSGENYYTKCASCSTVVGQKDYAFPSDFLKVMRLEYILSGSGDTAVMNPIAAITRNEQDNYSGSISGDPSYYWLNKDTFTLKPVPNAVKTIRLQYAYRVSDMSADGDLPDAPADYHEYLAIMAARDGFIKDGRDLSAINNKLGYFEGMLNKNAEQRKQDAPRMVVHCE